MRSEEKVVNFYGPRAQTDVNIWAQADVSIWAQADVNVWVQADVNVWAQADVKIWASYLQINFNCKVKKTVLIVPTLIQNIAS